jgi:hypothetical protein
MSAKLGGVNDAVSDDCSSFKAVSLSTLNKEELPVELPEVSLSLPCPGNDVVATPEPPAELVA